VGQRVKNLGIIVRDIFIRVGAMMVQNVNSMSGGHTVEIVTARSKGAQSAT
jgi:hypothetical protein